MDVAFDKESSQIRPELRIQARQTDREARCLPGIAAGAQQSLFDPREPLTGVDPGAEVCGQSPARASAHCS